MSLELLEQLEQKVSTSLDALELLKIEIEELKTTNQELQTTNQQLSQQQQEWEERLAKLLTKFSETA